MGAQTPDPAAHARTSADREYLAQLGDLHGYETARLTGELGRTIRARGGTVVTLPTDDVQLDGRWVKILTPEQTVEAHRRGLFADLLAGGLDT